MSPREHHSDYDDATTARCQRALVTLLGDLGPWRERVYLAGGLVPRYLVGQLPEDAPTHVGTTDVDLIIGLALGDETPETYRTLQNNLERSHFHQREPSFRWARVVDGGASNKSAMVRAVRKRSDQRKKGTCSGDHAGSS